MPTAEIGQTRFRRLLMLAAGVPVGLALVLAGVFLWQVVRLMGEERWVRHTHAVLEQVHRAERQVLRMQVNARGYTVSGSSWFLDRYRAADRGIDGETARLAELVADNPAQVGRARGMAATVDRVRGETAELIRLKQERGDYGTHMARPEFEALIAERDRAFEEFRAVEVGLLAERSEAVRRATWAAVWTSLVVTLVAGGVTAFVARRALVSLAARYGTALAEAHRSRDELERLVAERTTELREANAQLEGFNYSISHDLRAPLRAVQGFSQALLEDHGEQLGAEGRQYAERMVDAAHRMEGMIQDLLLYSRLTREELRPERVEVSRAVAEAMGQLDGELERAEVRVAGDLPAVRGHWATLVQVVANLLGNAAKFVRPGERPRITVRSEDAGGGRARVWVEDNGIGIADEHRGRIFNVFERLHGQEAYAGTGIGLAIVKKGVERMGGACGVESEVGRGSRFWIELEKA